MTVIAPPAFEPVTLAEVKVWLRLDADYTVEDDLLRGLIQAAREWAEHYTQRAFVQRTVEVTSTMVGLVGIGTPVGPIAEVVSLTIDGTALAAEDYYRKDGDLDNTVYLLQRTTTAPLVLRAKVGTITDSTQLPACLRAAMQLCITEWWEKRGDSVRSKPTAAENLLNSLRRWV